MGVRNILIGILLIIAAFGIGYGVITYVVEAPIRGENSDTVYEEETPYYRIEATYPADAPKRVEDTIATIIDSFKQDSGVLSLTEEDAEFMGIGAERKYALDVSYEKYESPQTYSYVFSIYQDTLGAHPNGFYATLTFDNADREVRLEDLFETGSRYLDRLSTFSYEGVRRELERKTGTIPTEDMLDTVRMGTAPVPEALQFFYMSNDTLHLLFPPYQVAAYAAGSFDIEIPKSELRDILKPEYQ